MNRVILMGRLTRDPDIRYSQSAEDSMAIARFTLAVDRRGSRNNQNGDQQSADFISCVAFRRQAEFAEKYLHQGTKIVLQGSIRTGSYTNKDGQRVYTTEVIADDLEFAESKAAAASGEASYASHSRPEPSAAAGDGFMNIPDDKAETQMRRRPMRRRKKVCIFCADQSKAIDYKDVNLLKRYVSERGKILPRRITGNCAKHQRALTVAVKRARHIALMPYSVD